MPLLLVVVCERSRASYNAGRESSRCSLPRVPRRNAVHTACPAISFAFASRPPKMIGRTLHRLCSFYCAVCAARASAPGPAQKLIISGSGSVPSERARRTPEREPSWKRECVFTAANPCAHDRRPLERPSLLVKGERVDNNDGEESCLLTGR